MAWGDDLQISPAADPQQQQGPIPHLPARPYDPVPTSDSKGPLPPDWTAPDRGALKTDFVTVPSAANAGRGVTFAGLPLAEGDAPKRVREAIADTYQNFPPIITPSWQERMNQGPGVTGWLNRNVVNPALNAVSAVPAAATALGAGATQTVRELATQAGVPANLQRDVTMIGQVIPEAARSAGVFNLMANRPTLETPVPSQAVGIGNPELRAALDKLQNRDLVAKATGGTPSAGAPTTPTGILGPVEPPPGYAPGPRVYAPAIETSAQAKPIAQVAYNRADLIGASVKSDAVDRFTQSLNSIPRQTEAGQITAGNDPATALIRQYQDTLSGKPLTLQAYREMDQALTDRIHDQMDVGGLSSEGRRLALVQGKLRNWMSGLQESDVNGGTAGFDALDQGRQGWAQYQKMLAVERMQQRAYGTNNPTTSYRTLVNNMTADDSRMAGWTPDETASLKASADRGTTGELIHALGGRLMRYAGTMMGFEKGGLVGAGIGTVATELGGAGIRGIGNAMMNERIAQLLRLAGQRVPYVEGAAPTYVPPR